MGNHPWTRESKRGRKPVNCPEHQCPSTVPTHYEKEKVVLTVEHKAKMQEGKQRKLRTGREKKIQEYIEGKRCECGIKASMNDSELRALYPGCRPDYICPVLDGVIRNVYSYV